MTHLGGSSHIGSVLSCADILAVLYGNFLKVDPENPKDEDRDRFILSKGHAGAGVYASLAERGFFKKEKLDQHYQNGSIFSGHVSHKGVPGVELSTGSLGHGLGVACGIAYTAEKLDKKLFRTVVLMSDGETDEGSVWEAAMFAGHFKLESLVAIIDYNKIQSLDSTENTMTLEPYEDKWRAFNWDVRRVDGHDINDLSKALSKKPNGKPICLICDTTKGKGVSFMENSVLWHYRSPNKEEYENAISEIKNI